MGCGLTNLLAVCGGTELRGHLWALACLALLVTYQLLPGLLLFSSPLKSLRGDFLTPLLASESASGDFDLRQIFEEKKTPLNLEIKALQNLA